MRLSYVASAAAALAIAATVAAIPAHSQERRATQAQRGWASNVITPQ